jgi:hypothetical protein
MDKRRLYINNSFNSGLIACSDLTKSGKRVILSAKEKLKNGEFYYEIRTWQNYGRRNQLLDEPHQVG